MISLWDLAPDRCVPAQVRLEREYAAQLEHKNAEYRKAIRELADLVQESRQVGLSWGFIGKHTGISRQGARQRWKSD